MNLQGIVFISLAIISPVTFLAQGQQEKAQGQASGKQPAKAAPPINQKVLAVDGQKTANSKSTAQVASDAVVSLENVAQMKAVTPPSKGGSKGSLPDQTQRIISLSPEQLRSVKGQLVKSGTVKFASEKIGQEMRFDSPSAPPVTTDWGHANVIFYRPVQVAHPGAFLDRTSTLNVTLSRVRASVLLIEVDHSDILGAFTAVTHDDSGSPNRTRLGPREPGLFLVRPDSNGNIEWEMGLDDGQALVNQILIHPIL